MRKIFVAFVALALALASCAAFAAQSPLTGGGSPGGDASLKREIRDGITVQFTGIFKSQPWPDFIGAIYTVTSDKDQVIDIAYEGAQMFDTHGAQLNPDSDVWIGNISTKSREIIEGIPTQVVMYYKVGSDYVIHERYARTTFNINGEKITFRNVPSEP